MLRVSADSGSQSHNSNVSALTPPLQAHIHIYYSVYDDFVYQIAIF